MSALTMELDRDTRTLRMARAEIQAEIEQLTKARDTAAEEEQGEIEAAIEALEEVRDRSPDERKEQAAALESGRLRALATLAVTKAEHSAVDLVSMLKAKVDTVRISKMIHLRSFLSECNESL